MIKNYGQMCMEILGDTGDTEKHDSNSLFFFKYQCAQEHVLSGGKMLSLPTQLQSIVWIRSKVGFSLPVQRWRWAYNAKWPDCMGELPIVIPVILK